VGKQKESRIVVRAEDEATRVFESVGESASRGLQNIGRSGRDLDRVNERLATLIERFSGSAKGTRELGKAVEDQSVWWRSWGNDIGTVASGLIDVARAAGSLKKLGPIAGALGIGAAAGAAVGQVAKFAIDQDTASRLRTDRFLGGQQLPGLARMSLEGERARQAEILGAFEFARIVSASNANPIVQRGGLNKEQVDAFIGSRLNQAITDKVERDQADAAGRQAQLSEQERQRQLRSGVFRTIGTSQREAAAGGNAMLRAELNLRDQINEARSRGANIDRELERQFIAEHRTALEKIEARQQAEAAADEKKLVRLETEQELLQRAESVRERIMTKAQRRARESQELLALDFLGAIDDSTFDRGLAEIGRRYAERKGRPAGSSLARGNTLLESQSLVRGAGDYSPEAVAEQTRKQTLEEIRAQRRERAQQHQEQQRALDDLRRKLPRVEALPI
jgi:hypothetical protein